MRDGRDGGGGVEGEEEEGGGREEEEREGGGRGVRGKRGREEGGKLKNNITHQTARSNYRQADR